jgi:hypothetical protein
MIARPSDKARSDPPGAYTTGSGWLPVDNSTSLWIFDLGLWTTRLKINNELARNVRSLRVPRAALAFGRRVGAR